MTFEAHHATCFVGSDASAELEAMRARWDPDMAGRIAAHVTLVYPREAPDSSLIAAWVAEAANGFPPFGLRLGALEVDRSAEGVWCGYRVDDVDGRYAALRARITAPGFTPGDVPPHVTLVHPRTSKLGEEAYAHAPRHPGNPEFWVEEVAITAWDGERWATVRTIPLDG